MESRQATTNIMKWQHADGHWVDAETQTIPLIGYDGGLVGVAEIFSGLSRATRRPSEHKTAANRDSRTAIADRGELETQLTWLVNEFGENKKSAPFSVIIADIDYFQSINEDFGHEAGDRVLIEIAKLIRSKTASGDLVGQYGGEEFVVICPSTNLDQACSRAERLRKIMSRTPWGDLNGESITASFGVAQMEPDDSMSSLLRRADRALYISKETGRNRTISLTNEEFINGIDPAPRTDDEDMQEEPFVFRTTFHACVAEEILVYKLGGFMADQNAKLVDANFKEAIFSIGSGGLLGGWGSTADRQPISLHVQFCKKPRGTKSKSGPSQVPVDVTIRPRGRVRDREMFQTRAKRVVRALRAYFAAN